MTKANLQSLQQKQLFLQLLIFSFATVLVWVGASLFLSQQHTGISAELQQLAKPLNPNIDIQVIDQIQQKQTFSQQDLQNFTVLRLIHNTNGTDTIVTTAQVASPSSNVANNSISASPASASAGPSAAPWVAPSSTP